MLDIAGGSGRRSDVANYVINLDVIKAPKRCVKVGTGRRVYLLPVVHATVQWICSLKRKKKRRKNDFSLRYNEKKKNKRKKEWLIGRFYIAFLCSRVDSLRSCYLCFLFSDCILLYRVFNIHRNGALTTLLGSYKWYNLKQNKDQSACAELTSKGVN